jgi:hypothetical protein
MKPSAHLQASAALSFEERMKIGEAHPAPVDPPKKDDLASLIYTSGTTGRSTPLACLGCSPVLRATEEHLITGSDWLR